METSFYSWIRKGLGSQISEADNLGKATGEIIKRPTVQLTAVINAKGIADNAGNGESSSSITRTEAKTIVLSGPGDVLSLSSNAVLRVFPIPDSQGFPIDEFPYIEFWEPDFAWRFTPAMADEEKKLRPWLALVVCKESECSVEKASWGVDLVTFNVEKDEDYKKIFPPPTDVWRMAHAQSKNGQDAEFCRILGLRNEQMDEREKYRAFLIPVFEVGRLRGLRGPDYDENVDKSARSLNNFPAQRAAWEKDIDSQKNNHELPLTFPSYYSWSFSTGSLSFVEKVRALTCNDAKKSGIAVDVTSLGEGLDYAVLEKNEKRRNVIGVPAALTTVDDPVEKAFPMPLSKKEAFDENDVYDNLNNLLSKSPIFEENLRIKNCESNSSCDDKDDPWITPPIYGGKHILATSLDEKQNIKTPWLNQINMDFHYRAAAGLGKKAVQRNQEELVNRAWRQIDAVKSLNAELNKKMLSANVSDSVKYLNYGWVDSSVDKNGSDNMLALMMKNLPLMKNSKFGKNAKEKGISLTDVMRSFKIPEAFASISFQNTAQKILKNNNDLSIFKSIAEGQWYQTKNLPQVNTINTQNDLIRNTLGLIKSSIPGYFVQIPSECSDDDIGPWTFLNYSGNRFVPKNFTSFDGLVNGITTRSKRALLYWDDVLSFIEVQNSRAQKNALIKNKFWEISSKGQTYSGYPIYALDDAVFRKLFYLENNSTVTVVKINSTFYINRDYAENVIYYHKYSNDALEKMEGSHIDGKDLRKVYIDLKTSTTMSDNDCDLFISVIGMFTPDRVRASDDFWKSEDYLDYSDPWTFCSNLVAKVGPEYENHYSIWNRMTQTEKNRFNDFKDYCKDTTLFVGGQYQRLFNAYNNLTSELHKELAVIETVNNTNANVSNKPDSDSNEKANALRNGLRDDSVYGRLKQCVSTYYKEFYTSEELVKNYLEDCLASKFPIRAYPIFPEPTYYYLKDIADEFIIPGIEELPDDSISMFKGNAAFIESYLCGMNTEMGRELLWREYPTDQRGSYFKKFWDSETTVDDIQKGNYFDVKSVHRWSGNLGDNHMEVKNKSNGKMESKGDLLFFAIKGDLMKVYPDTQITLRKATCEYKKNESLEFGIMDGVSVENGGILEPVSQAFVRDDIYVVGFKISFSEALGGFQQNGLKNSGYMLVFEKALENVEFRKGFAAQQENSAAGFASRCVITTSCVGKHVLTLIGKN